MGLVYADLELINTVDIALAKRNIIGEDEIKTIRVSALVDSGAYNMCINETIQSQLQLPFVEKRTGQLANGEIETYDLVGPITVKFRQCWCSSPTFLWWLVYLAEQVGTESTAK